MSKQPPLILHDREIEPGTREGVRIPVARLTTGDWAHLSIEALHGARPGPCLWLSGAIHGDELDGLEIIRRVLDDLSPEELEGTVLAIPVVNVFGLGSDNRYLPDRRDLNRSFPGGARGSMASRLAKLFMDEIVARSRYGIDFHCGSHGRDNLPHVRGDLEDEETRRLAMAFGAPATIHGQGPDGSLRRAAVKAGARVLVFEGGEAHRFTPASVEAGARGTLRVLAALGMIQDPGHPPPDTAEVRKTHWARANRSGIFRGRIALGQEVRKGELLGVISDTLGQDPKRVISRWNGIVIGRRIHPLVHQGEAVAHIAET